MEKLLTVPSTHTVSTESMFLFFFPQYLSDKSMQEKFLVDTVSIKLAEFRSVSSLACGDDGQRLEVSGKK